MSVHDLAGQPAPESSLVDVAKLVAAYQTERPDPSVAEQRVSFGTSGHRGSSLNRTFNEAHILATTQAICEYRNQAGIDGPLFLGMDTHAPSRPTRRPWRYWARTALRSAWPKTTASRPPRPCPTRF